MLNVKVQILNYLDEIAKYTGTDIFLLNARTAESEAPASSYGNGNDMKFEQRLRIAIYGDPESSEHAKTRVLIMIDIIVSTFWISLLVASADCHLASPSH